MLGDLFTFSLCAIVFPLEAVGRLALKPPDIQRMPLPEVYPITANQTPCGVVMLRITGGLRASRPTVMDCIPYKSFAMAALLSTRTNKSPQLRRSTHTEATRGISAKICSPAFTVMVPSRWP